MSSPHEFEDDVTVNGDALVEGDAHASDLSLDVGGVPIYEDIEISNDFGDIELPQVPRVEFHIHELNMDEGGPLMMRIRYEDDEEFSDAEDYSWHTQQHAGDGSDLSTYGESEDAWQIADDLRGIPTAARPNITISFTEPQSSRQETVKWSGAARTGTGRVSMFNGGGLLWDGGSVEEFRLYTVEVEEDEEGNVIDETDVELNTLEGQLVYYRPTDTTNPA